MNRKNLNKNFTERYPKDLSIRDILSTIKVQAGMGNTCMALQFNKTVYMSSARNQLEDRGYTVLTLDDITLIIYWG